MAKGDDDDGLPIDWEAAYHELRGLVERCYSSVAIGKIHLTMFIGSQQKILDDGKAQAALTLTHELLKTGSIFFTRDDTETEVKLTADMLVVRDRERFLKLFRGRRLYPIKKYAPTLKKEPADGQVVIDQG